jgi:hypothetical protein
MPNGKIVDRRPLTPEARDALESARAEFALTFGRQPQKGDRVFSAAHLDPDSEILQIMLRVAEETGKPQLAYAYQRTGLLITEQTYEQLSPTDRQEWNEAVDEYYDLVDNGIDPFTGFHFSVRDTAFFFLLRNIEEAPSDLSNDEGLLSAIVDRLRHAA